MLQKSLFCLFSELKVEDGLKSALNGGIIDHINVYKEKKEIEIFVLTDSIVPVEHLEKVERDFCSTYKLNNVDMYLKRETSLAEQEIIDKYWKYIYYRLGKKFILNRAFLKGCSCKLGKDTLFVTLRSKSAYILKMRRCDKFIQTIMKECFGLSKAVVFCEDVCEKDLTKEYIEFKNKEESKLVEKMAVFSGTPKVESSNFVKKIKYNSDNSDVIYSRTRNAKNTKDDIIPIFDVTADSGVVCVIGDVFRVEHREIRGDKYIYMFDVTDYKSSVTVKLFVKNEDFAEIKERIVPGISLKVKGEAQYDKFSKEISIMALHIVKVEKEKKEDKAEEKRVELHLHTRMSSMDAITSVKDLVKRAAEWGHKAIAITDHGVVQAFPDAHDMAKKNNIKIIYGVECYLVDDDIHVVSNDVKDELSGEFVVFDIETTGLNPKKDKITEIGAVKVKDFKIVGEYTSLINPKISIPPHIVKLTRITDEMVKDAPEVEQVLKEFTEFIGDSPVVAHNAQFDMGFVKHNLEKMGQKIDNTVVDTLQMSRLLLKDLKSHKLGNIAKYLGVDLENAHRALDDATATAQIFVKFLTMLRDKGLSSIDQINKSFDKADVDVKKVRPFHAIILVKNMVGLRNLYKMISESHLKYFYKKPRIPKKLLKEHREGLLLGSACEAGELYGAIMAGKDEHKIDEIVKFYDYLEIQPLGNNHFMIEKEIVSGVEELKSINKQIIKLAEDSNKPVVATCDVHFMDPEDEVFRRILMAGQGFSDADNQAPLYLRTTDEMLAEFEYLGKEKAFEVVVKNTNQIADMIEQIKPIPDGTFPPYIEGAETEIRQLSEGKAKEIYGEILPEVVKNQLDKELTSIIKNGFSVMYIISQKLVWKSLSDGYLVGSRGSVGSSFVANMVGITEVNSLPPHYICTKCKHSEFISDGTFSCGFDMPDKQCPECGNSLKKDGYDIPFETFLGFDGDKEPDIDLNFSGEYQSKAHKYTEELFGEGHVYRAGTIATIAEKTAYGFVKNYLDERNTITNNAELARLIKGCSGIKKTTGQHPGGVMIVPQDRDIYEFCPIQRPADDVNSNIITTHFDYHSISGRLLKLDILGHDDPTVIRMLEDITGIDATTIEIGEKRTMGIFKSTEPLGIKPDDINSEVGTFAIPEFGTKFVRQMLVDTKPTKFSELIRISGLSHGTDVWLNNAQELIKNKTATLSDVICTRDDIMLYLIHKNLEPKQAFKIMEGVRKGKGLKEEDEAEMRNKKVPEWYINSCKKIKYMFPKAHAAAYVMMAFRIAWFKVNHPEAFYATYFTVRADDFDAENMINGQMRVQRLIQENERKGNTMTQKEKNTLTILEVTNEMYARGIKFMPIDIYKSDASKFQIIEGAIRPPLNSLQGLGLSAAKNIIEERKKGIFISKEELKTRAKVSKPVIEILEKNKCLNGMPETSQISMLDGL